MSYSNIVEFQMKRVNAGTRLTTLTFWGWKIPQLAYVDTVICELRPHAATDVFIRIAAGHVEFPDSIEDFEQLEYRLSSWRNSIAGITGDVELRSVETHYLEFPIDLLFDSDGVIAVAVKPVAAAMDLSLVLRGHRDAKRVNYLYPPSVERISSGRRRRRRR